MTENENNILSKRAMIHYKVCPEEIAIFLGLPRNIIKNRMKYSLSMEEQEKYCHLIAFIADRRQQNVKTSYNS